jgi:hypothetical protein
VLKIRIGRLERFERYLGPDRRQNFLAQQVDLLVPIGVAEAQVENDMI